MGAPLNLIGLIFGKLTVASKTDKRKNGKIVWNCLCECGKPTEAATGQLRSGNKKSCGCIGGKSRRTTYEYRKDKPRLYGMWANMIDRCHGKGTSKRKFYRDKGITVCQEWRESLKFIKWALDNEYKEGLTIHRKDSNKGYSPKNCVLITKEEHYSIHNKISNALRSNNTTGYPGVSIFTGRKGERVRYTASITVDYARKHLGLFETPLAAHTVREQYKKEHNI